ARPRSPNRDPRRGEMTMSDAPDLESAVAGHKSRLAALRRAPGKADADTLLCNEYRAVLRSYRGAVAGSSREDALTGALGELRDLGKEAMLYLGGDADLASASVRDYDHERFGPYLGVSDEGSAAAVIRKAALSSPKVRV